MRMKTIIMLIVFLFLVGIQFIGVNDTNPPVISDLASSIEVKNILKVACYDCHSNETKWPWYSKIAPVSFFVANHVNNGRKHLNFSIWGSMYTQKQTEYKKEIWEEIEKGEMPLSNYIWFHPKAKLSSEQRQIIKSWAMEEKY